MLEEVDVLVSSLNGLPWLKLQSQQITRLAPARTGVNLFVHNSHLTVDGTEDWLKASGIRHIQSRGGQNHTVALLEMLKKSSSPVVAFMDQDAVPVKAGWLDEAVDGLNETILITGLLATQGHRQFVHPSFCVFRREVFDRMKLDPSLYNDKENGVIYDTAAHMTAMVEDAGFGVRYFGINHYSSESIRAFPFKVFHFAGSHWVTSKKDEPEKVWRRMASHHKGAMKHLHLWDDFVKFARESFHLNPLLKRYEQV